MAFEISEAVTKLWDVWNIRVLMIVSLSLQVFLNVAAPLRKKSKVGRKWFFRWPFWLAYLLADSFATYTIGLIFGLHTFPSDGPPSEILMFWAPFLLLHLGGPDNITSYALEDNDLWKRHLFQLILQVGFTIYIIFKFSSNNKLLVPAILVLFAGIIKYAERNIAFYRASLDHLGADWSKDESAHSGIGLQVPKQFQDVSKLEYPDISILKTAVKLFGISKRLLVGPLIDRDEEKIIEETFNKIEEQHDDVLRVMEIELSLLYEVLYTKLPVIASKIGFQFRLANLVSIFLALLSFSFGKRHYQLVAFDISLTYVLLVGAMALDIASMFFLIKRSDWFAVCRFQDAPQAIHKRRWSNVVSQSNLITYYVKECPVWLKNVADLPYMEILFQAIKDFQCGSSKNFGQVNELWRFIVEEVGKFRQNGERRIQEVWLIQRGRDILEPKEQEHFHNVDFTRSLLVLHIASEICFQVDNQSNSSDYKAICKLLSDYMFELAVSGSALMTTVLDNWNSEFDDLLYEIGKVHRASSVHSSNESDVCRELLNHEFAEGRLKKLRRAVELAKDLRMRGKDDDPWKVMSQIWVQFMSYAAINCRAEVHARQPSQGGELLTFVWLLMNHLGLGLKSYATLDMTEKIVQKEEEQSTTYATVKNLNSSFNVQSEYHINMFPWSMY